MKAVPVWLVATLWALAAPQQTPPQPLTGTGLILGRVVDGTTNRPVPNATVHLSVETYSYNPGAGRE